MIVSLKSNKKLVIETNSSIIVKKLRAMIYRDKIKHYGTIFIHFNDEGIHYINLDKNGRTDDWCDGFTDTNVKLLDILLGCYHHHNI